MNFVENIIGSVPFFSHLNRLETDMLLSSGHITPVKKGHLIDLQKTGSFSLVIEGIFEIETPGKSDIVYLSPGSFFGTIPFTEIRRRGNVRALTDSRLFVISEQELYRLFLTSHRALRGYIRVLGHIGLELSDMAMNYFRTRGKVVSVYSRTAGSGKSFLSSVMAMSLSRHDKTILLDVSYSGRSVSDYLSMKMAAPLSERDVTGDSRESVIKDRMVHVNENLDILNITFSSRVKIDPDIIGPVLFMLSKDYRFIVADLSDDDSDLRDVVLKKSDFIFSIAGRKDSSPDQDYFGDTLREGQRLLHVRNDYISGKGGDYVGGLILEKCGDYEESPVPETLSSFIEKGGADSFTHLVSGINRALAVQSARRDSVLLSGFFLALSRSSKKIDYMLSSSYSYILLSLYLLHDEKNLRQAMERFFSYEQVNRNLEITFPENHVFKNSRIMKYAEEIAGSKTIEMFDPLPYCLAGDCGEAGIFSTGPLKRALAASMVTAPVFQEIDASGRCYSSGFPEITASPSALYRTDADEIIYLTVNNSEVLSAEKAGYFPLYAAMLNMEQQASGGFGEQLLSDRNLVLEVSEREFKFDRILENTLRASEQIISKI